ncbi:MAG: nitroreductase family protein [Paludibacteraceae bacterium]|nr:nitroreductase family protein [Paludibacteraceae bacterium]
MSLLSVDQEKCIKCGICVQACPVSIVEFDNGKSFPFVKSGNEKRCIVCGHCEAICPEFALIYNPPESQVTIPAENKEVNAVNLGTYFRSRRSIREYLQKPVEKELLKQVMDIVRYAPTGSNQQKNQWVIVQSKEVMQQLKEGTINWMQSVSAANPELAKRLNFAGLIASFERGNDVICRNAPHLIIGYANVAHTIASKDVVIATSHLELLLPAFGLGGCWGGYLMVALQYSPDLKKIIGLDDTVTVHSALMIGYPKYSYSKIPARGKADIHWL